MRPTRVLLFVLPLTLAACPTPDTPLDPVDPGEQGPWSVVTEAVTIDLGDRGELPPEVPAVLYLADDEEARPLVLFSHGFGSTGEEYESYGIHLASHGVHALIPTYDEGFLASRTQLGLAHDAVGILDWLEAQEADGASPLHGRLDPSRLGAAGHSRGGKQSVHAAILDDRLVAVAGVDPVDAPPPYGEYDPAEFPSVTPEQMDQLAAPTLFVGAGRGGEAVGETTPCAPVEDNYHQFFEHAPAPSVELLVVDGGHSDFTDPCAEDWDDHIACAFCVKGADPPFTRDVARTAVVAFFAVTLLEDERYQPWVDGDEVAAWGSGVALQGH